MHRLLTEGTATEWLPMQKRHFTSSDQELVNPDISTESDKH